MEKYLKFDVLRLVASGTSSADGSAALTLTDATATFQTSVLANAFVFNTADGEFYYVASVDSATQLTLVAMGVTATQGGGIGNGKTYEIYMPFETVLTGGTTDGVIGNALTDSTKNFSALGVKVGDIVNNVTDGTSATVTGITTVTNPNDVLNLSADIMAAAELYTVFRAGADDFEMIIPSAGVANVINDSTDALESTSLITMAGATGEVVSVRYIHSDTGTGDEAVSQAISDAIVGSLKTEWTDLDYKVPGVFNPFDAVSNSSIYGGKEFFYFSITS